MPALAAQQHAALAPQRAQHADLLGRAERPTEQPIGHELLQPLAVQHVGLATGDILDVARIDQQHGEAARFEQLEQRDPIHAGGFHRHGVHPAPVQPVGQGVQVGREAGELAHRFIVPVGRHRHVVRGAADVDAGGIGVGDRQGRSGLGGLEVDTAIASGHGLLHHSKVECGAALGTSSCSLSQTGYRPSGCEPTGRFTNVDDVTQDHANPRAVRTTATSVFRSAAFHIATTQQHRVSSARFAAAGRLLR